RGSGRPRWRRPASGSSPSIRRRRWRSARGTSTAIGCGPRSAPVATPPPARSSSSDRSATGEQRARGGEGGQREGEADPDEGGEAEVDAVAVELIEPEEAGERAHRQQARTEVAADQRGEDARGVIGRAVEGEHVEQRHRVVVER